MVMNLKDMVADKLTIGKDAENELVSYCNKAFNTARTARLQFERQWYMNLAFYFGKQYAQWATSALDSSGVVTEASYSKLYEPAVPPWRVRFICNKIRPIIRGELAKVTKEKPRGFVLPASTDETDLTGARAAEMISEFLWRELLMNRVMRRAEFWNLICGTAFVKDWYDKNAMDTTGVKGSIMAEPLTPFHLLVPDLQEEELESQPYAIHVMAKDPDWVAKHFKDKNGEPIKVQADAGQSGGGILEQKFLSALGVSKAQTGKAMVSVKEAWFKPNGKFKDGLTVIWANDRILFQHEGFLYKHGQYPFTKLDHIPTGRFYGDSTIVDLMSLQKEYNRTRSQIMEAKNRMSKPQLLAVRGSVDPNRITSEPGLIIFYTPGFAPPTPLQLQNLPSYVVDEVERIQRDMDDVSSQHEITKGSVPPGVTAATAISFLQEQDDSKLSATVASLEEAVERLGKHFLSHVSQFWDAQRTVRVTGINGQVEAHQFHKNSVNGNIDFKVETGSATPISRAAKQAFIMELMKGGYITGPTGLKYLEYSETGRMYEEMQRDQRHVDRENLRLMEGDLFGPNSYDNDLEHVAGHEDFCKTEEYETKEDEIKIGFQEHITAHKQKMAMEMFGLMLPPGDPRLNAIGRGQQPPPMAQPPVPGTDLNGGQPQLNAGPPQGGAQNPVQEPSPAQVPMGQ
jgi:hypothetical protein